MGGPSRDARLLSSTSSSIDEALPRGQLPPAACLSLGLAQKASGLTLPNPSWCTHCMNMHLRRRALGSVCAISQGACRPLKTTDRTGCYPCPFGPQEEKACSREQGPVLLALRRVVPAALFYSSWRP